VTARPASTRTPRLPKAVIAAADAAKIIGVKAGAPSDHRFTGVWPIVVDGRLFARSWTVTPGGWFATFAAESLGRIQVGDRELRVRGIRVRSERLKDAIEAAYAVKYPTKASRKYVVGFRTPRRRNATIEFVATAAIARPARARRP
jgi:hypothetical protein